MIAIRPIFLLICVFSLLMQPAISMADKGMSGQKLFETPEQALEALKKALAEQDQEALVNMFGKPSETFFFTGHEASDKAALKRASNRFKQRAELLPVHSADHPNEQWYRVRYGKEAWNMRTPLVNRGKGWSFATEYATKAQMRFRRAMNEVVTVDTLMALAKAQSKYKSVDWNKDGVREYAQRFTSSPGKKDGLYWPAQEGEVASPLDAIVARAILDGYEKSGSDEPTYEGYIYRILTEQGKHARGGARSYLKDGKLTEGFAVLAYPVKWQASGDLTFMIRPDGNAVKKDLGFRTKSIASKIDSYNPDRTWIKVDPNLGGDLSRMNW